MWLKGILIVVGILWVLGIVPMITNRGVLGAGFNDKRNPLFKGRIFWSRATLLSLSGIFLVVVTVIILKMDEKERWGFSLRDAYFGKMKDDIW
jgi:hypothetical protein